MQEASTLTGHISTRTRQQDGQRPRFCVIGSGPAGAFVAVALAEAGNSVEVLECGGESLDSDQSQIIDKLDVFGGAKLDFGFSRQLGGSSNLWAGRVASLEPIDFAPRDWVPGSGWPFSFEDLLPYIRKAREHIGLPADIGTRSFAMSTPPGWQLLAENVDLKEFFWNSPPFNAGAFLRQAEARLGGRLRIRLNVHVRSLILSEDQTAVVAAEALIDGELKRLESEIFIIAAGGLETPRLLLNSGRGGIGNAYGNVGRYFSTHPKANIGLLFLNKRVSPRYSALSDQVDGKSRVRTGLGLDTKMQEALRTLNHCVQLTPVFEHQANRAFELIKGSKAIKSPLLNRNSVIEGILPGLGHIAFAAIGRLAGLQPTVRTLVLRGFLDQFPSPANRVYLSDQVDRMGRRKLNVNWTFSQADRESVLAFLRHLDASFRRSGLGRLDFEPLRAMQEWPLTGIHSHFMGTTRMGADPKTSVVDAHGKVHGVENLFVSGPSTFPTYGYANPFLTIAAMALRLADHLDKRMSRLITGVGTTPARRLTN